MHERSVWLNALSDLLEVVPLPRLNYELATMSSSALRMKAVTLSQFEKTWALESIRPTKIEAYRLSADISGVEILPGGNWIVKLSTEGTLEINHMAKIQDPGYSWPRESQPNWRFIGTLYMRRAFSPCGKHWVVVMDRYIKEE